MDFFLAGMETTTTTLRWGALLLAENQDVQDKIRTEILSVLGTNGKPTMNFTVTNVYCSAAIKEIQRCANIIGVNVAHRTVRDTSIGPYKIPADTIVLGQIHNVLANSPVFKDSKQFRPERFLMNDGVTPNKDTVDQFCPFSIGKRQCVGESLARVELFIGVVTMLQNYKIQPVKGRELDMGVIFSLTLLPKEQPLCLTPVSLEIK
ncbi:hypothetical protein ANCDUO_14382 [Ancylostoma duodenale]|uniref:Unspecific monooxygenase n=1 Tax=Ancylostoma duodenale TaxID=51022 RepID=A0A0C2G3I0_9BILA|nr:hypothetical protein ANCDUO_14382 [Ancylostoma duodenale]